MSRVVARVLAWLVWVPLVGYPLALLGVTGGTQGAAWALLALSPLLLLVLLAPRGRRGRSLLVHVLLISCSALLMARTAPPTWERMAAVADSVPLPPDAIEIDDRSSGDGWCMSGCIDITRLYEVPDAEAAALRIGDALGRGGWAAHESESGALWCRSGYSVHLAEDLDPGAFVIDRLTPGHEVVVVKVDRGCSDRD